MIVAPFDRSKIPHKPGIYMYKNNLGEVIYVGKAIDLFSRVSSYFSSGGKDVKTTHLVENIADIETIVVESELEALILEANLIKKYLPLYNIRLTDDKDYLYIIVTAEEFPRVLTGRKVDISRGDKYFGPFPSSRTVKETLKKLRRVFPWCSAKSKTGRGCFYYHLGLCLGPCVGEISTADYKKIINRFVRFLNGQKNELLEELTIEMEKYSKGLNFEEAERVRKVIQGILYLTQVSRVSSYLENPNFLEDERAQALKTLQLELKLNELPDTTEGSDISNI